MGLGNRDREMLVGMKRGIHALHRLSEKGHDILMYVGMCRASGMPG